MTTTIASLVTEVRDHLNEPSSVPSAAAFYSDEAIGRWIARGIKELCTDLRLYLHHQIMEITTLAQIGGDGMSFDVRQIDTTTTDVLVKIEELAYWDHRRQPIDWYQMWSASMMLTQQTTILPSMKRFGYLDNWTFHFNQATEVGDKFALFGRYIPEFTTSLPDFGGKTSKVEEFLIAKAVSRGLLLKPTGIDEQFKWAMYWNGEASKLKEEVRLACDQEYKQTYPHGLQYYKESVFISPLRQQIVNQ